VIVSHSWLLGGFGDEPTIGGYSLGGWAVAGFFVISGYLITGSRIRTTLRSYLWRRFLRIFPGLWACLAVCLVVFVPLSAATSAETLPALGAQLEFFLGNGLLFGHDYGISGSLTTVSHPESWNGSLWTLKYEFACYVLIGALLAVTVLRARRWTIAAAFAAVSVANVSELWLEWSSVDDISLMLRLSAFFLAGATLFAFEDRIPVDARWGTAAAAALVVAIAVGQVPAIAPLPLAYLCLWLGIILPLQRVGRANDISYGVYIYAFPVQQLLVLYGAAALGVWGFIALATICTVPLAFASWIVVERPAMRLKRVALRREVRSGPAPVAPSADAIVNAPATRG
jgi:peptidoglycan/LPS O-acetylase OafA/YrhL